MIEKHGIGFNDPQYRIYATDRPRPPDPACGFAKPSGICFDAANVSDDARTVSHNYTPGDRAVLSMPRKFYKRGRQEKYFAGGWIFSHFPSLCN
jgi:hypothetical protein